MQTVSRISLLNDLVTHLVVAVFVSNFENMSSYDSMSIVLYLNNKNINKKQPNLAQKCFYKS